MRIPLFLSRSSDNMVDFRITVDVGGVSNPDYTGPSNVGGVSNPDYSVYLFLEFTIKADSMQPEPYPFT